MLNLQFSICLECVMTTAYLGPNYNFKLYGQFDCHDTVIQFNVNVKHIYKGGSKIKFNKQN